MTRKQQQLGENKKIRLWSTGNSYCFAGGKGGRIINVASSAGLIDIGFGPITNCGYRVAKHAMVSMTRGQSKSTMSFENF